ncbi:MAG: M23 family metallopeptidase [Alistipes sp.]
MKIRKSILQAWWRDAFRKRRISLRNATDGNEEWHIHLSPANLFAAFVSFALLLFILILILAAYTPVMEFLPGYRSDATRSRESLIHDVTRLDSMERMMNDMMTYNENIALIMEGKTPVVRTVATADSTRMDKTLIMPTYEDSLLRVQMEGKGVYSLAGGSSSRRSVREALEMVTPVEGTLTEPFDIKQGRLGVAITATASSSVTAAAEGTVVMSLWTPETGYLIQLQHSGNLLSVYKQLSQSLVTAGQKVHSGEVIGYAAAEGKPTAKLFEFELWSNGKPVDPQGYILF